jgi:hypothetical protein
MGSSGHWLLLLSFLPFSILARLLSSLFLLNFDFFPEAFQNIYQPLSLTFSVRFPSFPASVAVVRMM